ncbi:MAG: DUF6168 family protein [Algibacter sp.]
MILKNILVKCVVLLIVVTVAFFIHLLINNFIAESTEVNQLIYSYSINALLAIGIITLIFLLKKKLRDQLGFVFMGTSMLKFVFFFILFYPGYNADGDLSRLEFLTFFIPYVISLIAEGVILSKFFNDLDHY